MNIEEIEHKITELEAEWKIYHKLLGRCKTCNNYHNDVDEYDHELTTYSMPNMVELVKLRILRKEYD